MKSAEAADQGLILGFLERVDRRLRTGDVLKALGHALWGLPVALVLWKVSSSAFIIIYTAGLAGSLLWIFLRRSKDQGLVRSAAVADRRADLKDALKSSLTFLGLAERSEWMDYQIGLTASVAETLDAPEIAPAKVPRAAYHASGLTALVGGLLLLAPGWLPEPGRALFWPFGDSDEPETMAELLDESTSAEAEELLSEIPDVEETLSRLRERNLDLAESLADLKESQEALAASRLDMEQLQSDLERIGDELASLPSLSDLTDALEHGDAEKAAELLRELAKRLENAPSSKELQALLEALQNANVQQADLENLKQTLENMQNADAQDMAQMMDALQQAANQLESMGEQMAQQSSEQMNGEQSLQASMGEQQAGQQQQGGEQQQQAGGQAMQSAAGMMSQMQMAQMQGDPSNAVPVDAGPAGEATGPGGSSEDQVMGDATTLEVQLEMEILETEERDQPIPEDIFERLSREEKSTLNYESVSQRGSYAEESALSRETVPWPYRSLVKRYFLSLVSRAEAKSESSAQK